jgi:hypothetical protein
LETSGAGEHPGSGGSPVAPAVETLDLRLQLTEKNGHDIAPDGFSPFDCSVSLEETKRPNVKKLYGKSRNPLVFGGRRGSFFIIPHCHTHRNQFVTPCIIKAYKS